MNNMRDTGYHPSQTHDGLRGRRVHGQSGCDTGEVRMKDGLNDEPRDGIGTRGVPRTQDAVAS